MLYSISHKFLLCTLRADDVLSVSDESLSYHTGLARPAGEAVVVPMATLERDESGSADTCDRFTACGATLREQFPKAVGAVDVVFLRDETFGSDWIFAGAANEAFLVPLTSLVLHLLHTSLEDVSTSVTSGGKLGVIARAAVDSVCL